MTDLHCHILPGIDDGAQNVSESLEILSREYEDGVRNIALTSHFNSKRTGVEEFLERRQKAFEELEEALHRETLQQERTEFTFKLGAEVFFSPELCELDAESLCMEGTSYMLVEFPTTHRPHFIRQTFNSLNARGIYPIIAHVERYPFIMENPPFLYELVAAGAYAQINAGALLQKGQTRQLLNMIKWDLVHVVSTDTHSLDKRPPQMAVAMKLIESKLGKNIAEQIRRNGTDLFYDQELDCDPYNPRKFLGRWV